MEKKKPLAVDCKRLRVVVLKRKYKYSKYSALLKALINCEPIEPSLFNRLKERVLCEM